MVCSPPYALGRVALLMIGSHTFRYLAIFLLAVAIILQTGATSAVKAIKMSAKLAVGKRPDDEDVPATAPATAAVPVTPPAEVAPEVAG